MKFSLLEKFREMEMVLLSMINLQEEEEGQVLREEGQEEEEEVVEEEGLIRKNNKFNLLLKMTWACVG